MDPLQFTYQASRGVEDAILTLLLLLHTHLEKPNTHAKILFLDFSSAFNTMQPKILADILANEFDLNTGIIYWILDFLTSRVQRVSVGPALFEEMMTSTGSPQGCVLSSLLFIL